MHLTITLRWPKSCRLIAYILNQNSINLLSAYVKYQMGDYYSCNHLCKSVASSNKIWADIAEYCCYALADTAYINKIEEAKDNMWESKVKNSANINQVDNISLLHLCNALSELKLSDELKNKIYSEEWIIESDRDIAKICIHLMRQFDIATGNCKIYKEDKHNELTQYKFVDYISHPCDINTSLNYMKYLLYKPELITSIEYQIAQRYYAQYSVCKQIQNLFKLISFKYNKGTPTNEVEGIINLQITLLTKQYPNSQENEHVFSKHPDYFFYVLLCQFLLRQYDDSIQLACKIQEIATQLSFKGGESVCAAIICLSLIYTNKLSDATEFIKEVDSDLPMILQLKSILLSTPSPKKNSISLPGLYELIYINQQLLNKDSENYKNKFEHLIECEKKLQQEFRTMNSLELSHTHFILSCYHYKNALAVNEELSLMKEDLEEVKQYSKNEKQIGNHHAMLAHMMHPSSHYYSELHSMCNS